MDVSLPFEGHNVAYQCKGLDLSNNVCEYEVNRLTNEKRKTKLLGKLFTMLDAAAQPPGCIHQSINLYQSSKKSN